MCTVHPIPQVLPCVHCAPYTAGATLCALCTLYRRCYPVCTVHPIPQVLPCVHCAPYTTGATLCAPYPAGATLCAPCTAGATLCALCTLYRRCHPVCTVHPILQVLPCVHRAPYTAGATLKHTDIRYLKSSKLNLSSCLWFQAKRTAI